jgi:hypothetical protein
MTNHINQSDVFRVADKRPASDERVLLWMDTHWRVVTYIREFGTLGEWESYEGSDVVCATDIWRYMPPALDQRANRASHDQH